MAGAKTIVCFGDSNTHGYNNKNGKRFSEHVRWPMVLQELLGEEYLVREEGLSRGSFRREYDSSHPSYP